MRGANSVRTGLEGLYGSDVMDVFWKTSQEAGLRGGPRADRHDNSVTFLCA